MACLTKLVLASLLDSRLARVILRLVVIHRGHAAEDEEAWESGAKVRHSHSLGRRGC